MAEWYCPHCGEMVPEKNWPLHSRGDWNTEPVLQRGRPYDGAIINKDSELVIPKVS